MKFKEILFQRARPISWSVLTALLGVGIFAGMQLPRLTTGYSIRQFLIPGHPLLVAENKVKADFALPEWPYVYVNLALAEGEAGTFLDPARVAELREATKEARALAGVSRVVSLATVEGASSSSEGLTIGKVLDLTPENQWAARVMGDPLLTPNLISKDGRAQLVAVGLTEFDTYELATIPDELRALMRRHFPSSQVTIGGIPAVQGEMAQTLRQELRNFLGLALLACMFTLFVFFRDKASIFVPLGLVALANVGALAWMVEGGLSFTVLSTTLPVIVSIVVLSIVTHTMINFAGNWEKAGPGADKAQVVARTLHSLFLPNFLTALTTSLGFVALLGTRVPVIYQYAECVAVGVMIAWALVMLALPALMILLPVPRPRRFTASRARWSLWVIANRKWIFTAILLMAVGLAYKGKDLNWSARLFDDLPEGREARTSSEFIDAKLGGLVPLELILSAKKTADAWNDPDRIRKLAKLTAEARAIPGVGSATGLADFIAAGALAQNRPMPDTRPGIAEMIFIYSLSDDHVLNQYLTPGGDRTRLALRLQDVPADRMQALVAKIRGLAQAEFPGFDVQTTGMSVNVHAINEEVSRDLIYGFWQAILLISLVLVLVFRSLRWTLVAMLPNLISPAALMGAMAIHHTPIKPGIALIFSIALGIAYNNTVYLLGRVRLLQRQRGDSARRKLPVAQAWLEEGNPCVFSTLALVGGFAVFLASYFSLNQLFGAYMLLSIGAGLLGDLVFLPAMLGLFPGMLGTRRAAVAAKDEEEAGTEAEELVSDAA